MASHKCTHTMSSSNMSSAATEDCNNIIFKPYGTVLEIPINPGYKLSRQDCLFLSQNSFLVKDPHGEKRRLIVFNTSLCISKITVDEGLQAKRVISGLFTQETTKFIHHAIKQTLFGQLNISLASSNSPGLSQAIDSLIETKQESILSTCGTILKHQIKAGKHTTPMIVPVKPNKWSSMTALDGDQAAAITGSP